ncbi:uncharacterized protein BX663DRAFT_521589 [Cokeromyces recurvatus]|uniref:uncharacterized protein n=1 Tax=Cokeromyces recurvatus TaxID=90255 RepID=UPI00221F0FB8|nr:uncharacterized protein BX663DRAFT_521589 [Cokeromyces recurvatus]KAI7899390.1 hypothetical protein BX663DRAFT_521589 [Cokeromyces recurvatus]
MSAHSSLRRRGTGSTSAGPDYPNYIPLFRDTSHTRCELELPKDIKEENDRLHIQRKGSFQSFFTKSSILQTTNTNDDDEVEDVKTDVLYPRYKASQDDDHVDMDAFQCMLHEGTLQLSKTLSRQNQLYSSSRHGFDITQPTPIGVRFQIYSAQKGSDISMNLENLLTEEGQKALKAVIKSRGWWVDVLCPSIEEMRVISKTFHIHPLTTEDIQAQEPREKVEIFPNYTFVCFRAIEVDPFTDQIKPFNFYSLIFKEGFLTFHFKKSDYCNIARQRCNHLKEYITITPDWMNYALIDSITDSFAPIISQVEMEAVSIDELSMVLKETEQTDMLKRIGRCRKKSTHLVRLLGSKIDVIKSLMKRYEDKSRDLTLKEKQQQSFFTQLNHALTNLESDKEPFSDTGTNSYNETKTNSADTTSSPSLTMILDNKKVYTDTLLYLGDIQDHILTMVQNISHYDRILHRAHTNYLAQVNIELIQTYNLTNEVMNRLTFLATVFIPLTLICGLWGMNVAVPGKYYGDLVYFYWILGGMAFFCVGCLFYGKRVGLL